MFFSKIGNVFLQKFILPLFVESLTPQDVAPQLMIGGLFSTRAAMKLIVL